jgi:single-strand DNA-binding protein
MNSFNAIGRIGRDAVTRHTTNGKAVTGWALAVDSGWGDNKQTVWLDCSLWGDRGEKIAPYITKGSQLGVSGEIGTREHEGKTYVTLNVRDVTLIGGKTQATPAPKPKPAPQPEPGGFVDDDIPFAPLGKHQHWIA